MKLSDFPCLKERDLKAKPVDISSIGLISCSHRSLPIIEADKCRTCRGNLDILHFPKSLEVGGDVLSCGVDRVETLDMKTEELHRLLEVDRLLLDLHLPLILRESFSYIETPRLIIVLSEGTLSLRGILEADKSKSFRL